MKFLGAWLSAVIRFTVFSVCLVIAAIGADSVLEGCRNPQEAKTVADITVSIEEEACVLAQIELGQKEPAWLAAFCRIPLQQVINIMSAAERKNGIIASLRTAPLGGGKEGGKDGEK